ncbi:hypothetical protein MBH78_04230 [Oceanimonas sp. NS1]|nr:hypothetical protein [Oceanimonas sp. NS1]
MLTLSEGEVIGKSDGFRESLSKLYACESKCLTLSGEAGVGKRFLAGRWADLHNISLLDFSSLSSSFSNAKITQQLSFLKNKSNNVCVFIQDVVELPEEVQSSICSLLSMNVEGCHFVFSCSMDSEGLNGCSSITPELLSYLKQEWISIPSLRARGQDSVLLARVFLQRTTRKWNKNILGFSAGAEKTILDYSWPGNISELNDRVMVGVSRCESDYLEASMMGLSDNFVTEVHHDLSLKKAREKAEAYAIKRVLDMVPGRTGRAAELLCISKSSLHRLIARYGIRR